jgi:hypothetical protein
MLGIGVGVRVGVACARALMAGNVSSSAPIATVMTTNAVFMPHLSERQEIQDHVNETNDHGQ